MSAEATELILPSKPLDVGRHLAPTCADVDELPPTFRPLEGVVEVQQSPPRPTATASPAGGAAPGGMAPGDGD